MSSAQLPGHYNTARRKKPSLSVAEKQNASRPRKSGDAKSIFTLGFRQKSLAKKLTEKKFDINLLWIMSDTGKYIEIENNAQKIKKKM